MARDPDAKHRRLAAIVFTDIVGYSAIVNRDEAAGARALDRQRRVVRRRIAEFGGREIETAGDSFLLEFASAYAALRAIALIQRDLAEVPASAESDPPVQLRASLHVGEITHRRGEVFGDVVNIAARLLPLASPGGLALSAVALDAMRGRLPMSPRTLGPCQLKNIAEPVEVLVFDARALAELPIEAPSLNPDAGNRGRWRLPVVKLAAAAAAAALALLVGGLVVDRYLGASPGAEAVDATDAGREANGLPRIAVLPFSTFSSGADDSLLAAGLQDSVLTNLARSDQLRVISRTTMLAYREPAGRRISDIAAELDADTVVEGSLSRVGDRLIVQVQLIDGRRDQHLWAAEYERRIDDLFGVQREIARDIASAIAVQFTQAQQREVDRPTTLDIGAWTAYQRALDLHASRVAQRNVEEANDEALARDPDFALAWVLRAELHVARYHEADDRSIDRLAAARDALARAAQLQPDLPELHRGWGLYYADGRFDLDAAVPEYEAALRAIPSDVRTLAALAAAYRQKGRLDDALQLARRVVELAPRDRTAHVELITTLEVMRRFRQAESVLDRFARIDGESRAIPALRARLALARGDADAIRRWMTDIDFAPTLERFHYYLGEFDAAIGEVARQPEWQTGEHGADAYPVASNLAALHWLKGDADTARRHAREVVERLARHDGATDPAPWDRQLALAQARAILGERDAARMLLDAVLQPGCCDNPTTRADLLAPAAATRVMLGDHGEAIALLEQLLSAPAFSASGYVALDPAFRPLHDEPAFIAMLERARMRETEIDHR